MYTSTYAIRTPKIYDPLFYSDGFPPKKIVDVEEEIAQIKSDRNVFRVVLATVTAVAIAALSVLALATLPMFIGIVVFPLTAVVFAGSITAGLGLVLLDFDFADKLRRSQDELAELQSLAQSDGKSKYIPTFQGISAN